VKLIAPQLVKPYVKSNKNDTVNAEAICQAAQHPNMGFVAVKDQTSQFRKRPDSDWTSTFKSRNSS